MAITDDITLGTTAAHLKDLTDPAINPLAVATATSREGGFVCRNRINFGSATVDGVNSSCDITMPASALSTTNVVCNQLYVLDIPKRTTVKTLKLYAIEVLPLLSNPASNRTLVGFNDSVITISLYNLIFFNSQE